MANKFKQVVGQLQEQRKEPRFVLAFGVLLPLTAGIVAIWPGLTFIFSVWVLVLIWLYPEILRNSQKAANDEQSN